MTFTSARFTSIWSAWPCLIVCPCVSRFTSSETRDWAETTLGKLKMVAPKSKSRMSCLDRARALIVIFFMIRPDFYFAEISLRLFTGDKRERVARCLVIASRAVAPYPSSSSRKRLRALCS